jgi:hypothetical protein
VGVSMAALNPWIALLVLYIVALFFALRLKA